MSRKRVEVTRATPPVASPPIAPTQRVELATVVPQMNTVVSDCIEVLSLSMRHFRKQARTAVQNNAPPLNEAESRIFTRDARTLALMMAAEDKLKERSGLTNITDDLLLQLVPLAMKALAEQPEEPA